MSHWSDGVGRTIIVAGIAGALFAGFLALTPRLTAANIAVSPATTVSTSSVPPVLPSISDPVVAVPAAPADVQVTVTTEPVSTTTVPQTGGAAIDPAETDPGFDGTITLQVDARPAGQAAAEGILVEGEELQWRFTVTNTSAEELWGTYVYLELHGPAWCDTHNLKPGDSTDCWIATTAVEGSWTAHAWATAWTEDRLVKAAIDYSFDVSL